MAKKKEKKKDIKPVEVKYRLKEQFTYGGMKRRIMDRFRPHKTMLIEMTHYNGTVSHYVLPIQQHKFNLNGGSYIVDEECKVYDNTSKLYMLRYHEGFALPYKTTITSTEMKEHTDVEHNPDLKEIQTSFNPTVLIDILKFEYAKGVIQGAEVSNYIKRSFIIIIITLVGVLGHFLVNAMKSGWI